MSKITTHVLDTSKGKPASRVKATLFIEKNNSWQQIASGETNSDGRINDLLNSDADLKTGTYKMNFDTGKYFSENNVKSFYPNVEIIFEITSGEHYHIPLLLSPFGYTTYRGS